MVFYSTNKYTADGFIELQPTEIKQIAGRAGRYSVAPSTQSPTTVSETSAVGVDSGPVELAPARPKVLGLVTTFSSVDLPRVRRAMTQDLQPLRKAYICPPTTLLSRFAGYFRPNTPLSYIYRRYKEISELHPLFHFHNIDGFIEAADAVQDVPTLTLDQRIILCNAPVQLKEPRNRAFLKELAGYIGTQSEAPLLNLKTLPLDVLDAPEDARPEYLVELEVLHYCLTLYLWLSYRFNGYIVQQDLAMHTKKLTEEKIMRYLERHPRERRYKTKFPGEPEITEISREGEDTQPEAVSSGDSSQESSSFGSSLGKWLRDSLPSRMRAAKGQ